MLWNESSVIVADNTGAKEGKIIRVLKGSNAKSASIGDVVVVAIKEASPDGTVKKGDVCKGVVVRTRKEVGRKDGSYIRFSDNAIALLTISEKGEVKPLGKRIFGPVAMELRDKGFKAIATLAEEVI